MGLTLDQFAEVNWKKKLRIAEVRAMTQMPEVKVKNYLACRRRLSSGRFRRWKSERLRAV